jgi:hypothetical protein
MPDTSDQSMPRLTFAAKFPTVLIRKEQSESMIIASFIKGFDGHKKFHDVLRKLDEELAVLIRQECVL